MAEERHQRPGIPAHRDPERPTGALFGSLLRGYRSSLKRLPVVHRLAYAVVSATVSLLSVATGFRTRRDDPLSRRLEFVTGTYEPGTTALLDRLVNPGATVLDIGAHVGYFTRRFSRRAGPRGRVVAFEPNPETCELLRTNVGRRGNVVIVEGAVADAPGTFTLYDEMPESGGSSLRPAGSRGAGLDERLVGRELAPRALEGLPSQRHDVAVSTVDATLAALDIDSVDVVKLDVEGAELLVLRGMERTLASSPGIRIVMELNPGALEQFDVAADEPFQWLVERGFEVRVLDDEGGAERLASVERLREIAAGLERGGGYVNLLCVRRRPPDRPTRMSGR